jgi:hypothetical protein
LYEILRKRSTLNLQLSTLKAAEQAALRERTRGNDQDPCTFTAKRYTFTYTGRRHIVYGYVNGNEYGERESSRPDSRDTSRNLGA